MLKLLHYSNQDFKGMIKPSFFGKNNYTKQSLRESDIDRSFFYCGRGKEYFLNDSKFCYTSEIESSKVYDLTKDIKNLKTICNNFNDILKRIKFLGYRGVSGNNGYNIVCLFYSIKYIDKVLDKSI